MPRTRPALVIALIPLVLALAACGGGKSEPPRPTHTPTLTSTPAPPTATLAPGETPFPGAKDPVERNSPGPVPSLLVDVRAASHSEEGGFDRITFEFQGNGKPSYRVEYITPPETSCGSGEPVPVAGKAVLQVRFGNTNAHNAQGDSTVQPNMMAGFPALQQAALSCDFEAVVVWALGISDQLDFRVTELENPPRVAVDIAHP